MRKGEKIEEKKLCYLTLEQALTYYYEAYKELFRYRDGSNEKNITEIQSAIEAIKMIIITFAREEVTKDGKDA